MATPARPQGVAHDLSEYLYFSPSTKGLTGNPVKIRADLFMDFFCNVDPETHDGQCVIRDIESLKIFGRTAGQNPQVSVPVKNDSAAHKGRLNRINQTLGVLGFNQSISPEKTFYTKNVHVSFRILQNTGDLYPTIYISDIRVMQRGNAEPGGLYEYISTMSGGKLTKAKNTNLEGKTVFVSRASDSAEDSLDSAIVAANNKNPAIFFCPKHVAEDLRFGSKHRLSKPTKDLINELSDLLQKNQKRSVEWHIEGEGAAVLSHALAEAPGTFETYTFKFTNAHADLAKLLQELGKRKAQLHGEFLDYSRDRTALLSIAQNYSEITTQLKELPFKAGFDHLSRRYLIEYFRALGENGNAKAILAKAASIKGSNTTFIEAITLSHKRFK